MLERQEKGGLSNLLGTPDPAQRTFGPLFQEEFHNRLFRRHILYHVYEKRYRGQYAY